MKVRGGINHGRDAYARLDSAIAALAAPRRIRWPAQNVENRHHRRETTKRLRQMAQRRRPVLSKAARRMLRDAIMGRTTP